MTGTNVWGAGQPILPTDTDERVLFWPTLPTDTNNIGNFKGRLTTDTKSIAVK